MKRIFVTGNAGSGKSTLARALAETLAHPMYSLDQIVWQSGLVGYSMMVYSYSKDFLTTRS